MTTTYLDKIYSADSADLRPFYAQWAQSYDQEVGENGYVTPLRIAEALARHVKDLSIPILDYGCGTGVSGQAFQEAGFLTIDGVDISAEMLEVAAQKKIYRRLEVFAPEIGPNVKLGAYQIIAAVGVIGAGAAPLAVLDKMMALLAPKGLLVFSFNDHTLEDPAYDGLVEDYVKQGQAVLHLKEYGDHLPKQKINSNIYILEKL
ncbi:MAG: methyltransferase domain-containing protein [Rhodobacteraceae bacterium]|nr:methyltransferase domain-containing protein [Paracoccaceae bacterium]MBL6677136.1 methyltransferase domain-containing protein [Paracoccaceae bacterium]MBL6788472.1 methyltransferase domain-containing protein [Paracoccaceae bacterium]MBL6858834.1 methyltransferase domain-containing protein [Paracoccaceae bacterium]